MVLCLDMLEVKRELTQTAAEGFLGCAIHCRLKISVISTRYSSDRETTMEV